MVYQRIVQIAYAEELLDILKASFVKYFEPFLVAFVASLHALNSAKAVALEPSSWNFAEAFKGWDRRFDELLHSLEDKVSPDHQELRSN